MDQNKKFLKKYKAEQAEKDKQKEKTEAEKEEGYIFTTVKELPITSVKNQHRAGTCWCYSGLGFIESELLRMGKGEYDLSEMFIIREFTQKTDMSSLFPQKCVSFKAFLSLKAVHTCRYHASPPS